MKVFKGGTKGGGSIEGVVGKPMRMEATAGATAGENEAVATC